MRYIHTQDENIARQYLARGYVLKEQIVLEHPRLSSSARTLYILRKDIP